MQWQLPDLRLGEWISDRRILRVDDSDLAENVHCFRDRSHLQIDVERRRSIDLQAELRGECCEASQLTLNFVHPRRQLSEFVCAHFIGNGRAHSRSVDVRGRDRHARNERVLRVSNRASERTGLGSGR